MSRRALLPFALVTLSTSAVGCLVVANTQRSSSGSSPVIKTHSRAPGSSHTKWIDKSLREMQTVKVGMTRAQLAKVFTTEGGVSSRRWRRYVYRECPYIKVDVEFRPVGKSAKYPHAESRKDVIAKISRPFLEWSIQD